MSLKIKPDVGAVAFVDSCLKKASFWRRNGFLFSLCLCNLSDAVEIVCIGYILAALDGASLIEQEMLGASVIIGMVAGGIITGQLADVIGRKICLQISTTLSACAALASSFSPSASVLIGCRIVGGFGMGGVVPSIYALGAELFQKETKTRTLTLVACAWIFGSIYASVAGWICLGDDVNGNRMYPDLTWRSYAIVCAIPSFLAILSTFLLVESPHFLIEKKKYSRAAYVLSCISQTEVTVQDIKLHETALEPRATSKKSILAIFGAPFLYPFVLLCIVWFTACFTGYGLLTWIAKLFFNLGYTNAYADACILSLSTLPGNLISVLFINRIGKKEMLSWGTLLSGFATTGFALQTSNAALVLTFASLYGFFNAMSWNAMYAVGADSYFPTQNRSGVLGLLTSFGRLGGIIAQFVYGDLQNNVPLLLLITSGTTIFGAMVSFLLPADPTQAAGVIKDMQSSKENPIAMKRSGSNDVEAGLLAAFAVDY